LVGKPVSGVGVGVGKRDEDGAGGFKGGFSLDLKKIRPPTETNVSPEIEMRGIKLILGLFGMLLIYYPLINIRYW